MKRASFLILSVLVMAGLYSCADTANELAELRSGFETPPLEARPRALWDWVDGNFQLEEITREMEEAKKMGLGGFDIWDVRSVMDEQGIVPQGPAFMSEPYVEAIVHAINEAERLEMDLGLIFSSGWNAGGSWTLPEHQTMGLFQSEIVISGPLSYSGTIPFPDLPEFSGKPGRQKKAIIPKREDGLPVFYKEVALQAYPLNDTDSIYRSAEVVDLSARMDEDGRLSWEVPEGHWKLVRYVCTNTGQPMISSTPNSNGPMIDHFSAEASERHILYFIEKLEAGLGKPIGESGLSYFYTDSYEVQGQLWTPELAREFEKRMDYSMLPYLPALEGAMVDNANISRRFLYDYRKVLSDLIIENHYQHTRELCEEHGVGFVAEAAGPGWPIHNCPFESLKSSGSLSFPRGEFWHIPSNNEHWLDVRESPTGHHFMNELDVIKGVASASHLYNQKFVEAESFTGIHLWNEGPGDLKPTVDRAFCEGLNRIIFHTWPHTPENAGTPGWAYAFGTLMNDNRIWWPMAGPFMEYLGRSSFMLQQGDFAGDILCYYGDSVPNFAPAKGVIPELGFGYDYDVCNSDILLNALEVVDGKFQLPHGPVYEALYLPDEVYMQADILRKIAVFTEQGGLVAGPMPERSHGLYDWERRDSLVLALAQEVWERVCPKNELRAELESRGVFPDLEFSGEAGFEELDFIHRKLGENDIYFIANKSERDLEGTFTFRQETRGAEIWDPSDAGTYPVAVDSHVNGTSSLQLSLDAYGSVFIVFSPDIALLNKEEKAWIPTGPVPDDYSFEEMLMEGPWKVHFPEESAGAGTIELDSLVYWNRHENEQVRFFSGIAVYELEFDFGAIDEQKFSLLELSELSETARLTINGEEAGIIWKRPYRIDVTDFLREGKNVLRIEVANTWANGLCGDARLPADQKRTRTNVTRLPNAWIYPVESIPREEYGLLDSGLAGPVKIVTFKISQP